MVYWCRRLYARLQVLPSISVSRSLKAHWHLVKLLVLLKQRHHTWNQGEFRNWIWLIVHLSLIRWWAETKGFCIGLFVPFTNMDVIQNCLLLKEQKRNPQSSSQDAVWLGWIVHFVPVSFFFPLPWYRYPSIYPEQYEYMLELKQILETKERKGHALLEMPTGTGKTMCILAVYLSLKDHYPNLGAYWMRWSDWIREIDLLYSNDYWTEPVYGRIEDDHKISKRSLRSTISSGFGDLSQQSKEFVYSSKNQQARYSCESWHIQIINRMWFLHIKMSVIGCEWYLTGDRSSNIIQEILRMPGVVIMKLSSRIWTNCLFQMTCTW